MYLISWMVMNISTIILNKFIYQAFLFNYPMSLTAVHMITCSIGSFVALRIFHTIPLIHLSWDEITYKVFPLSVLFCSNIVLGNVSLRWVPVSFMQTVKSSVPAFTVFLQVIFFRKAFSRSIFLSLIPIVGGVVVASYTEVNFNQLGFWSALIASVITALMAIVSGVLLTQQLNAINLLYYMAPFSAVMLLPLAYWSEWAEISTEWEYFGQIPPVFVLILSGVIAFLLNIFTFLVIKSTSPLTYTVAGNFKVVLSITVSVAVFQNEISKFNALGCAVAVLGVMWYNHIKFQEGKLKEQAK